MNPPPPKTVQRDSNCHTRWGPSFVTPMSVVQLSCCTSCPRMVSPYNKSCILIHVDPILACRESTKKENFSTQNHTLCQKFFWANGCVLLLPLFPACPVVLICKVKPLTLYLACPAKRPILFPSYGTIPSQPHKVTGTTFLPPVPGKPGILKYMAGIQTPRHQRTRTESANLFN